ncbi:DltD N-terminal domain protein [Hypoxylon sp. NC1633]|nr:DltD N-terminal domain protein [Hypoxylon sp. NC1633]
MSRTTMTPSHSFMRKHPLVDPARIAFWGYAYSAMVALCAAALDKRVAAVVSNGPIVPWQLSRWSDILSEAMRERESLLAGNKPVYIPIVAETQENPAGFGSAVGFRHEDVHGFMARAEETIPTMTQFCTLSSYYHIAAFQPDALLPRVSPTPALLVIPEDDKVSPAEQQQSLVYDVLREPKQLLIVPGKAHLDFLDGQGSTQVLDVQVSFLRSHLGGS